MIRAGPVGTWRSQRLERHVMSTQEAGAQQSQPRRSRRRLGLALAVLFLVPFFSLGLGRAVGGRTVADRPLVAAAVRDNFFEPAALEIPAGTTVVWTWEGRAPHNIIGKELEAPVQTSGTFSHAFAAPGTYDYVCTLHRGMHGRIMVTSAPD